MNPETNRRERFPSVAAGLALTLLPSDEALRRPLRGAAALPSAWLEEVEAALARSELGERIGDESWPEDWRLVSARATVCSPLGRVADPEEAAHEYGVTLQRWEDPPKADAIVAAGSAVSRDVDAGELRMVRAEQLVKPGWADRFHDAMKKKKKAAGK